jgi:hypothetical protein
VYYLRSSDGEESRAMMTSPTDTHRNKTLFFNEIRGKLEGSP